MEPSPANSIETQPRWRFSLRTAMVALFLGCILLGISAIVGPKRFVAYAAVIIPILAFATLIYGAATRSRRWLATGIALLVTTVVLGPILWDAHPWSGSHSVPMTFLVIDAQSESPIGGAQMTWKNKIYATTQSTDSTDRRGRVTFVRDFDVWGSKSFSEDQAQIDFGNHAVRVTAPGYAPVSFQLADRIGEGQDLADPLPDPIRVELHAGDDSTAPEEDPLREYFIPSGR